MRTRAHLPGQPANHYTRICVNRISDVFQRKYCVIFIAIHSQSRTSASTRERVLFDMLSTNAMLRARSLTPQNSPLSLSSRSIHGSIVSTSSIITASACVDHSTYNRSACVGVVWCSLCNCAHPGKMHTIGQGLWPRMIAAYECTQAIPEIVPVYKVMQANAVGRRHAA